MEDCCAVCVEPLEWVAYGPCGHQDVCSICIARLRFVLCDKQCCICKQDCPSVFVTKALGDYTKAVDNFEALAGRKDLWYESNVQAYFDDEEQYKMVKSMCKLSCSICEGAESAGKEFMKKGFVFRNLDLLRRHLFHAHKAQMCGLCLEGRKVFICEQKLYTKKQLDRHLQNGNSEIDLNDEDRGWFNGHPLCNFCHTRFYGDNELYQHMSTDHYTCHLCQRLRPGQYEYYRNYDDLEAHFRHDHALCEHPECLDQKFVVFGSDAELKRHNALVHGGNMSRAQRNAALQIPVSFQYRRPGQDHGGNRPFRRRDSHSNGGGGSQASNETSNVVENAGGVSSVQMDNTIDFPHFQNTESTLPVASSLLQSVGTEGIMSSLTEPSRYLAAVSGVGPSSLKESAFPPLPGSESVKEKSKQPIRGSPLSMASMLGGGGRRRPLGQGNQDPARDLSRHLVSPPETFSQWPQVSASQRPQRDTQVVRESSGGRVECPRDDIQGSTSEMASEPAPLSAEEIRAANKALRESIQLVLQGDEGLYDEFKFISAQFRSGEMDANVYLHHVERFGLLHIVPELARLCPDSKKKDDLLEVFRREKSNQVNGFVETRPISSGSSHEEEALELQKNLMNGLRLTDRGGGAYLEDKEVEVLSKDGYRDSKGKKPYMASVLNGQIKPAKVLVKARKPSESPLPRLSEAVLPIMADGTLTCPVCTLEMREGSTHCAACGTALLSDMKSGGYDVQVNDKKKKKKATKLRMGDGSTALLLDARRKAWAVDGERGNSASGVWSINDG